MSSEITFKNPLEVFSSCNSEEEINALLLKKKKISIYNKLDNYKRVNSPDRFKQMKRTWALGGNSKQKKLLAKKEKQFKNNPELIHPSFREKYPSYHQLFEMGELQGWRCAMTGTEFDFNKSKKNLKYPSIDRIDSNKGYILSNMWIVCTAVNLGKSQFGLMDVLNFFNFKTPIIEQVLSDLSKGIEPTHNDSLKTASIKGL